jgi:hypothetical protein
MNIRSKFLIITTFILNALQICGQWNEVFLLEQTRKGQGREDMEGFTILCHFRIRKQRHSTYSSNMDPNCLIRNILFFVLLRVVP